MRRAAGQTGDRLGALTGLAHVVVLFAGSAAVAGTSGAGRLLAREVLRDHHAAVPLLEPRGRPARGRARRGVVNPAPPRARRPRRRR